MRNKPWTSERVKHLRSSFSELTQNGHTMQEAIEVISKRTDRSVQSVRYAVYTYIDDRPVEPKKAGPGRPLKTVVNTDPVPPVAMIDGIEVTDFGSFDVWKKAVEKLREKGRKATVKDGCCYLDGKTVSLMVFCQEAGLELA